MISVLATTVLRRSTMAVLIALALGGCQHLRGCDPPTRAGQQRICKTEHEACRARPSFTIDEFMVQPEQIRAGGTVTRRMVYTYCPRILGKPARGSLQTSIEHGGRQVASSVKGNFLILPGQYTYDASITTPGAAPPGVYMLETRFDGLADTRFKRYQVFKIVRSP